MEREMVEPNILRFIPIILQNFRNISLKCQIKKNNNNAKQIIQNSNAIENIG